MTPDPELDTLLERCSRDSAASLDAFACLMRYRRRGLEISQWYATGEDKVRALVGARDQLRDDLRALVEQLDNPPHVVGPVGEQQGEEVPFGN